ncbi:MAG: NfeD family protein [Lutisporaceae bacterium]
MQETLYQGLNLFTVFLFVLGLVLLMVEATFPGFGVAGISGVIVVIASIIMISDSIIQALLLLIGTAAIVALLLIAMIKLGWAKKYLKFFVLSTEQNNEEGYRSNNKYTSYIGKKGIVLTPLRSAGTILIDSVKLDAVSEGEFISKDAVVEVLRTEGSSIFVREIKK